MALIGSPPQIVYQQTKFQLGSLLIYARIYQFTLLDVLRSWMPAKGTTSPAVLSVCTVIIHLIHVIIQLVTQKHIKEVLKVMSRLSAGAPPWRNLLPYYIPN